MTEEQKAERIHAIVYSCDSREELAQRIVKLEDEFEKQKIKLEVLKAHGIEIVDAAGGGHETYDTRQREVDRLEYENTKLRELVSLYHYGATHEASPSDVLAWSAKVDSLRRELGIEETNDRERTRERVHMRCVWREA